MIFGINCVLFSIRSEPGAGISEVSMASGALSSKRSDIKVLVALRRYPIIIRFITRKMIVPLRIVKVFEGRKNCNSYVKVVYCPRSKVDKILANNRRVGIMSSLC